MDTFFEFGFFCFGVISFVALSGFVLLNFGVYFVRMIAEYFSGPEDED